MRYSLVSFELRFTTNQVSCKLQPTSKGLEMSRLRRYRRNVKIRALKLWTPLFVLDPEEVTAALVGTEQ